jgi:hypothetical protein
MKIRSEWILDSGLCLDSALADRQHGNAGALRMLVLYPAVQRE